MDEDLQRRYHAGELAALERLWERHEAELANQASRLCADSSQRSQDALQQVYVKLSETHVQEQYDPKRPWLPWVQTVLKNTIQTRRGLGKYSRLGDKALRELAKEGVPKKTLDGLLRILGKRYSSEEAFQNALLEVLSPEEIRRFGSLIAQAAEHGRSMESLDQNGRQLPQDPTQIAPMRQAELHEFGDAFQECFERLTQPIQDIFTLHVLYRYTFEEVSQHVRGKADSNLASGRYYRAVRDLRRCLEGKGYSEADL